MDSTEDNQCAYIFATGKRRDMRCERPKSAKDVTHNCYCSYHYKEENRAKRLTIIIPSNVEVEKPKETKKSVIESLSPNTLKSFNELFEQEQSKMRLTNLYRAYKKERYGHASN